MKTSLLFRSKSIVGFGEFGKDALFVEDFNILLTNGLYRGSDAVGIPLVGNQIVLEHYEGAGGRDWQVARSQMTSSGVKPRTWERYRATTGVWTEWDENAKVLNTATLNQGIKADSALQPTAGHPSYLFFDGSDGVIFDFTDRQLLGVITLNDKVSTIPDLLGKSLVQVPSANTAPSLALEEGRIFLQSVNDMDLLASPPEQPLLPATGDFVLAWSHKTVSTGTKACIWQHQPGAVGRTQISANTRYNGSALVPAENRLQVFMGGATEGSGVSGMIVDAPHPIGQWDDFVLVLREGSKQSAFYRNGALVDNFTRPASFPQVQTTMFRHPLQPGTGHAIGRVLCLRRSPQNGELDLIRNWIRESFTSVSSHNGGQDGAPWVDPAITSAAAVIRSKPISGVDPAKIWGLAENTILRPGSMTKLMTAYVGLNWLKKLNALGTLFTRTSADANAGSGANLAVGDTLDVTNALANMGLPSSNVTANMWARTIGSLILSQEGATGDGLTRFITAMNDANAEIGLTQSTWRNASGLDATGHLSSATDMSVLCGVASSQHPEFNDLWSEPTWQLQITGLNPRSITITHSVRFIANGDNRIVWGKTGTTTLATNCLLCEVRGPNGNRYFYVGFGATTDDNRYIDADKVFAAADQGVDWPKLIPTIR